MNILLWMIQILLALHSSTMDGDGSCLHKRREVKWITLRQSRLVSAVLRLWLKAWGWIDAVADWYPPS
jgi:hypothetical protein